jgi:putative Mn2+ efflux pump MntP
MLEVIVLSVALAMDAFAVSIGLGSKNVDDRKAFALKVALFFGFFQGFMPFLGYLAGIGLESFIKEVDHWIAFVLLAFIGGKMIYESFGENIEDEIKSISNKMLLTLAIATSIDALAAGFTLTLFSLHFMVSIIFIGAITFMFSYVGIYIGTKGGTFFQNKAEFFGGVVLILIGFKILFTHLGVM